MGQAIRYLIPVYDDLGRMAVVAPGTFTDNCVLRGDGTNTVQGSSVTLDDSNNMVFPSGKYISINYLKDPDDATSYIFRTTGATKATQISSGEAYLKIYDDSISLTNGSTGGTLQIDSDGDSFISGVTFEARTTNGTVFSSDVASTDGISSYFRFINRIGKSDWDFAKFIGNESWQGLKFYADPELGGAETAYIKSSDGTASFTNVCMFTHGEGNPSNTPTNLVEMYRDDTNGNLFAWNGIEWGLITLGALPT